MMCLHCGETVNEADIVYERRFGNPFALWYCPTEGCDGAGVGFDLHPAENFEANRRLEDSDAD